MDQEMLIAALKRVCAGTDELEKMYDIVCKYLEGGTFDASTNRKILNFDWPKQLMSTTSHIWHGHAIGPDYLIHNDVRIMTEAHSLSWSNKINTPLFFAMGGAGGRELTGVVLKAKTPNWALDINRVLEFFETNLPKIKFCSSEQDEVLVRENIQVPVSQAEFIIFKQPQKSQPSHSENMPEIYKRMPLSEAIKLAKPHKQKILQLDKMDDDYDKKVSSMIFSYPG